MLNYLFPFLPFILFLNFAQAQQIHVLESGRPVSLRGLSVVSDRIIWTCGSSGSVGLSTDGGKTWKWIPVPGFEKSDFRDIEAFGDREAFIMSTTEPAVILRTTDGGLNWQIVFRDSSKTVFLDDMDFSGMQAALVGDPVQGKIFFAESNDRGIHWKKNNTPRFYSSANNETFFAASGSNLSIEPATNNDPGFTYYLVSGGKQSSLYISGTPDKTGNRYHLNLNQGKESTGANSIAVNPVNPNQAFIVGGDFINDTLQNGNSLLISLYPFSQKTPIVPPHGYRSCVEYLSQTRLICCGKTGVDISCDSGLHWSLISDKSFHVCRKSKNGTAVFLAGPNGSIGLLVP